MRVYRETLLSAICVLFSLQSALSQPTVTDISSENCHIQIDAMELDGAQGHCKLYDYGNMGTRNVYIFRSNQDYVFWGYYLQAKGRYFPDNTNKAAIKKQFTGWPYIKDNWSSISAFDPRTTYVNKNLKVVLYKIILKNELGCVAFSKGFGARENDIQGVGGQSSSNQIGGMVCPISANASASGLLTILESINWSGQIH